MSGEQYGQGTGSFVDDERIPTRVYECASTGLYAAPGFVVIIEGMYNGRKQRLAVDPDEIDELAKRLHAAKRYARSTDA